jgi:hypothetical protein
VTNTKKQKFFNVSYPCYKVLVRYGGVNTTYKKPRLINTCILVDSLSISVEYSMCFSLIKSKYVKGTAHRTDGPSKIYINFTHELKNLVDVKRDCCYYVHGAKKNFKELQHYRLKSILKKNQIYT